LKYLSILIINHSFDIRTPHALFTYRNDDNLGITCRIRKIDVAPLTAPAHRSLSVIITLCNKARTAKRER